MRRKTTGPEAEAEEGIIEMKSMAVVVAMTTTIDAKERSNRLSNRADLDGIKLWRNLAGLVILRSQNSEGREERSTGEARLTRDRDIWIWVGIFHLFRCHFSFPLALDFYCVLVTTGFFVNELQKAEVMALHFYAAFGGNRMNGFVVIFAIYATLQN
jgi:hypothetical protein